MRKQRRWVRCRVCAHYWFPQGAELPGECPACSSRKWQGERALTGVGQPLEGPRLHTCLRCHHQWFPKSPDPARCARCTSPYWNRPRSVARSRRAC